MRKSEVSTEIIAGKLLRETKEVMYTKDELVVDILNSIYAMEDQGFYISKRVQGNDKELIIEFQRKGL